MIFKVLRGDFCRVLSDYWKLQLICGNSRNFANWSLTIRCRTWWGACEILLLDCKIYEIDKLLDVESQINIPRLFLKILELSQYMSLVACISTPRRLANGPELSTAVSNSAKPSLPCLWTCLGAAPLPKLNLIRVFCKQWCCLRSAGECNQRVYSWNAGPTSRFVVCPLFSWGVPSEVLCCLRSDDWQICALFILNH